MAAVVCGGTMTHRDIGVFGRESSTGLCTGKFCAGMADFVVCRRLGYSAVVVPLHLHLVSDSTGETLDSAVKAGLAQFEQADTVRHSWPLVRSQGHLERVLAEIAKVPGLVLFTLVEPAIRSRLESRCAALGLPVIAVLDPVIAGLSQALGRRATARAGGQHALDEAYFRRIEAINWTMEHDDGLAPENWEAADIVLMGVSRTSKTPTSVYLANRGYKVANMPIVPEQPLPSHVLGLKAPLVVGLTVQPERLVQVRRARVLGADGSGHHAGGYGATYVAPERVAAEIAYARRLFADRGWPVIDVTRRSIEETAAAVLNLLTEPVDGHRMR